MITILSDANNKNTKDMKEKSSMRSKNSKQNQKINQAWKYKTIELYL